MKKLIRVKDIETAIEREVDFIEFDKNTIITPLAKDMAKLNDIEFKAKKVSKEKNFDIDSIYKLFEALDDNNLLNDLINSLSNNYFQNSMDCGLKLIRGESIKYQKEIKHRGISQQIIINSNDSLSLGIMNFDSGKYTDRLSFREVNYIISGKVKITIGSESLIANTGDIIDIPKGLNIIKESNKAKLLYVKYPINS